jgi:hypothetical protein
VRDGGDVARLVGDPGLPRQPGRDAAAELLPVEDLEHLPRVLRSDCSLLADEPQQSDEPARGDPVVDPVLERRLVLDATPQVYALEPELDESALEGLQSDQIEQEVRREIAARGDHVLGELGDAQRPSDLAVDLAVRIAIDANAKWRPVERAEKPVAHVHARLGQQAAAMDRVVHAEEDGQLDRARGVEPAVAVIIEVVAGLEVRDGDGEPACLAQLLELRKSPVELAWRAKRRYGRATRNAGRHGERDSRNGSAGRVAVELV